MHLQNFYLPLSCFDFQAVPKTTVGQVPLKGGVLVRPKWARAVARARTPVATTIDAPKKGYTAQ